MTILQYLNSLISKHLVLIIYIIKTFSINFDKKTFSINYITI